MSLFKNRTQVIPLSGVPDGTQYLYSISKPYKYVVPTDGKMT